MLQAMHMWAQEHSVVRCHHNFYFWGCRSPFRPLCTALCDMEGQNQPWPEAEAQSPRCTEASVASFCHVPVGNCISGPEVCSQHYWSCNLVLWPGTCLSTAFLSLTTSKVAKKSHCHELGTSHAVWLLQCTKVHYICSFANHRLFTFVALNNLNAATTDGLSGSR